MNAPSELRMHRRTQRELVQQSPCFSKTEKEKETKKNRCSRVTYTPNTSPLARSSPRRHVTTSPRPRRHEDGGGRFLHQKRSRPVAQQSQSRNESLEVGAAEELFPFPFSIGCIKGKRQLRAWGCTLPFHRG